jgi:hypothetical protein
VDERGAVARVTWFASGSRAMLTAIRGASSGVNHQHRQTSVR